jgi:hypothetical protein
MQRALTHQLVKEIAKLSFNLERGREDIREQQIEILQYLTEAGIEPALFDLMLSNELDRRLKKQFGVAFFAATVVFTGDKEPRPAWRQLDWIRDDGLGNGSKAR